MKFADMDIDKRVKKALVEMKFVEMTEIQEKSIKIGLQGRDIIGQAMTGSGKTAAFGIPVIQAVEPKKGIQALILTPTRELAVQVSDQLKKFSQYCSINVTAVFGGVSIEPQISALRTTEIIVGTPGRILDHMQRGTLKLNKIKALVLDEADRMLDMGFIDDIRKILSVLPEHRQTLLFSATMPEEIVYIARRYMKNPERIVTQRQISKHLLKHIYFDVKNDEKLSVLLHMIEKEKPSLAIVFCGTRRGANYVDRFLREKGIEAKAIHGGITQSQRMNVLEGFHRGRPHILVATDVAARGLDIKNVSHVFNYDIPKTVDDYTHRVGRTARFGKSGKSICLLAPEDHNAFRNIIRRIEIEKGHLDFKPEKIRMHFSHEYGQRRNYRRRRY